MFYIRLLKKPRYRSNPVSGTSSASISTVVTVTTDLGESFFIRPVTLLATLRPVTNTNSVLSRTQLQWKPGFRALKVEITFDIRGAADSGGVVLEISSLTSADNLCALDSSCILNVFSCPVKLVNGTESDEYVERRLKLGPISLSIWEETGESIARHIWDGGFALAAYLAQRAHIPASTLPRGVHGSLSTLDALLDAEIPINILELGSGCGIVGLSVAALYPQCKVTLSDLQLAEEVMQRNLDASGLIERARCINFDWEEDVPPSLLEQAFDIVLVADCFYNAASAPHLVDVLMQLTENARDTTIVLAHKKRHDSENVFFELLESFVTVNRADFEVGESYVNLYVLKRGSG